MELEFSGKIWLWGGKGSWFFVTVPDAQSRDLKAIASSVTYGWGNIPVQVQIGSTTWKTSLFPQHELYVLPVKASVRKAENLQENDDVTVRLNIQL